MNVDINFKDLEKDEDNDEDPAYCDLEPDPEPDPEPSPEEIFLAAIRFGDKSKFVAMIDDGFTSSKLNHPQDFLSAVCKGVGSVGCASALIKGETRLTVDIRSPCWKKRFPLHMAALTCNPGLTELLLVNNAQTGVRFNDHECFTLPLHLALRSYDMKGLKRWTPKKSINQLLFSLCLPDVQDALENVGLLAWTTKHTEKVFLRYVKDGQVVEVAALMMVAWKKLRDPAKIARRMLTQNEVLVSRDMKTAMLQLFEIFDGAGDDLEAYVKQRKLFVCKKRAITEVKYLLQRKGIHVKHEETDLSYLSAYGVYCLQKESIDYGARLPHDIFMDHYGKSGYRWTCNPSLWRIGQRLFTSLFHHSPNTKYTNSRIFVPATTVSFGYATDTIVEALNNVKGWRFNLSNVVSNQQWASFASLKKFFK